MNAVERFVFGRPLSLRQQETRELPQVAARPATALAGRLFLSAIFLISGIMKFVAYDATLGYAEAAGLPWPEVLVPIAAVVEILGGLSILTGLLTRIGALALGVFVVLAAFYFHDFWNFAGAEQQDQMAHFFKNMAILGAMMLLIAFGAGRYSIDRMLRKRMT